MGITIVTPRSLSSPERRSLWRFRRSSDQCVEMELPVFSHRPGKPSSADVASVVYARQCHPRTARFQLNNIAGFERLCHSPNSNFYAPSLFHGSETGANRHKTCRWPHDENTLHNGCGCKRTRRLGTVERIRLNFIALAASKDVVIQAFPAVMGFNDGKP
jgi:hypothetical protein